MLNTTPSLSEFTDMATGSNDELSDAEEIRAFKTENETWNSLIESKATIEENLNEGDMTGDEFFNMVQEENQEVEEETGLDVGGHVPTDDAEDSSDGSNQLVPTLNTGDALESISESGDQLVENVSEGTQNAGEGVVNWVTSENVRLGKRIDNLIQGAGETVTDPLGLEETSEKVFKAVAVLTAGAVGIYGIKTWRGKQ